MASDDSDCSPRVYFYIGTNDSDDEDEGFESDYESLPECYMPLLAQIWNDIGTWEEGQNPPLELAIKILRILKGLKMTPHDHRKTFASCNGYLNKRVAKVAAAIQEYKELLCTQVSSILEEKDQQELSELKEEIQQIKKQIQHDNLWFYQNDPNRFKKHSLLRVIKEAQHLRTDLEVKPEELHSIISEEKPLDQDTPNKEEDN